MSKKTQTKEAPVPAKRTKTVERLCRYVFNKDELLDIGKRLAESQRTLAELEADKSRVMKDYASRISAEEANGGTLVTCISSGYEMRKLACTMTMHDPKPGMKTTRRNDNGETVDVVEMAPFEMQEELDLQAEDEGRQAEVKANAKASAKQHWDELKAHKPKPDDAHEGGFRWNETDGTCENPAVFEWVFKKADGSDLVKLTVQLACHAKHGWRRGIAFSDTEPELGDMLELPEQEGVAFEWPQIVRLVIGQVQDELERREEVGPLPGEYGAALALWWHDHCEETFEWLTLPGKAEADEYKEWPQLIKLAVESVPLVTRDTPLFEAQDAIGKCTDMKALQAVVADGEISTKLRVLAERRCRALANAKEAAAKAAKEPAKD